MSKATKRYLNNAQWNELASAAVTSYEGSCCWARAAEAVQEHALEEFDCVATRSQIGGAVNLAKHIWEGMKIKVQLDT